MEEPLAIGETFAASIGEAKEGKKRIKKEREERKSRERIKNERWTSS